VSAGTDLSPSFLSLVENGRSDISTGRLFRLARFYGVGIEELLDPGTVRPATVLRAEERMDGGPPRDGVRAHPVADGHDDLAMAPVIYEYAPGARIPRPATTDGTQHFLFVVRGTVEMTVDGDGEPLRLGAGDSAYCGEQPVTEVLNAGDDHALVVWVSSPPTAGPGRT